MHTANRHQRTAGGGTRLPDSSIVGNNLLPAAAVENRPGVVKTHAHAPAISA